LAAAAVIEVMRIARPSRRVAYFIGYDLASLSRVLMS
jgi:hypothetical protein